MLLATSFPQLTVHVTGSFINFIMAHAHIGGVLYTVLVHVNNPSIVTLRNIYNHNFPNKEIKDPLLAFKQTSKSYKGLKDC